MKIKVAYIISDIDKALAFEWIATYINKDQFEICFILLNPSNSHLEDFMRINKIPFYRVHCQGKKDWPIAWLKLWRILNVQSFDVVHCHLFTANILGLSAAKMAGIKTRIYTRHHSDFHFRYFPKGVKWDKMCNILATKIIAPSKAVISVLTNREAVPHSKINLVHHGFDLDYFKNVQPELKEKLRGQYNPNQQHPVIGVISRFTELKGIQYVIPAFKKLLCQYPNALLLLFNAQGEYQKTIDLLLKEIPKENYTTILFEPELGAIYSLFDIFVQVSTDTTIEAFGQTYVEALAAGVPSVFTLSGIANEFIENGDNAMVVRFNNEQDIFASISLLLDDKNLRNKLINNGRLSVVSRFSIHEMIQNLEKTYLESYKIK